MDTDSETARSREDDDNLIRSTKRSKGSNGKMELGEAVAVSQNSPHIEIRFVAHRKLLPWIWTIL